MSLRDRQRFIRDAVPAPKPVLKAVPAPEPEPEEVIRRPRLRRVVDWRTRDDCPICNSRRDELGRLPIGLCGSGCLMARPK